MKKLAGLFAFAAALLCAILLTQYYSRPAAPAPPPPPPPPSLPSLPGMPTAPDAGGAGGNVAVSFKPRLVTLDPAGGQAVVRLVLERDPARPAPASVWVWAYFFSTDAPGRYCAGEPVEVRQPFAAAGHAEVTVEMPVAGCPAPRGASTTYYARVNVSAESAFAARLAESRISYDISQASPVVVGSARKK
jgi:hypothetical protein